MSDDAARTADGRLFYACGAATEHWSPRVDRLTGGTIRVAVADKRSGYKSAESESIWMKFGTL